MINNEYLNSTLSSKEIIKSNIKKEMTLHKSAVYVVKFSKDGQHIISGSQDKTMKLWNPYKGLLIKSYDNIHSHDVLDIAVTQDNSKIASVGVDKQVYYTDSITGNVIKRFYGHTARINTVSYNSFENILVTGSYDTSVRIFDLKSQSRDPIQTLMHGRQSISKVIVLNDKIISASTDGNVRVYDIRMGQLMENLFDTAINGMDVSIDEKCILVSGLDDKIRLYELDTGKVIKVYQGLHKSKNYPITVKFTINNDSFYTTSENNDIISYDLINNEKNKIFKGHNKESCGLDIHPNKNGIFVSSGFDGKIILWETE